MINEIVIDHPVCPFQGHDGENVNIKFFRGSRNDIITAKEMIEEARSAGMQLRMGTADRSSTAPVSLHPKVDVREWVKSI